MEVFDLSQFINLNQYMGFIYALAIGVLLGIDHELIKRKGESVPGLKSFIFVSLLGSLLAYLSTKVLKTPYFFMIGFICIFLIFVVFSVLNYFKSGTVMASVQYTLIMTFILGSLCIFGYTEVATVFTLVTVLVNSLKKQASIIFKMIDLEEIVMTAKFIITAIILLPFLPNKNYTLESFPWLYNLLVNYDLIGSDSISFTFLNPHQIWSMVIVISLVSFVGYLLMKLFGKKGLAYSTFFRGLVSSNGVVMNFSAQSKQKKADFNICAFGIIMAFFAMILRGFFDVLFINSQMLKFLFFPFICALLAFGSMAFVLYRKGVVDDSKMKHPAVQSPFSLKRMAFLFGVFFIVMIASRILFVILGQTGIYIVSFASGLLSFNAVNLSLANLALTGEISPLVATFSSFLALVSNTMFKGILIGFIGEKKNFSGFVNLLLLFGLMASAVGFMILKFFIL
ncbi:MgtC/SapB family protein [Candidatus Woesearchaeota archaeon]|nr:MgtC/SapB family protein [Candidatus Woesearchaeota archaeon]